MPQPQPRPGVTELIGADYDAAVRAARGALASGGSEADAAQAIDRLYPSVSTEWLDVALQAAQAQMSAYGEFLAGEAPLPGEYIAPVPGAVAGYTYHAFVYTPDPLNPGMDRRVYDRITSDTELTSQQVVERLLANRAASDQWGGGSPDLVRGGSYTGSLGIELIYVERGV